MATITNRYKKVTTFLMEIRSVMQYCRALVTGGTVTGIDDLQNQFLVNLLANPRTCPTPSLMWETGNHFYGQ